MNFVFAQLNVKRYSESLDLFELFYFGSTTDLSQHSAELRKGEKQRLTFLARKFLVFFAWCQQGYKTYRNRKSAKNLKNL